MSSDAISAGRGHPLKAVRWGCIAVDMRTAREAAAAGDERSAQHQEFMNNAVLESIGLDPENRRHAVMWDQFHHIIVHEGDTSAINAWDNQILTIGAGFSQRHLAAGAIYNRLPPAMRQRLYMHGIRVNEDNSLTVLDLDRGVVETGRNALRLIQVNPQMLALMVQLAQSTREETQGDTTMSQRQWMMRAQFEQFLESNSDMPQSALGWPGNSIRFALLLRHWQGVVSWRGLSSSGGVPNAMANYALGAIFRAHGGEGLWTEAYIQRRISGLARDSGVGQVAFRSRPAV